MIIALCTHGCRLKLQDNVIVVLVSVLGVLFCFSHRSRANSPCDIELIQLDSSQYTPHPHPLLQNRSSPKIEELW